MSSNLLFACDSQTTAFKGRPCSLVSRQRRPMHRLQRQAALPHCELLFAANITGPQGHVKAQVYMYCYGFNEARTADL